MSSLLISQLADKHAIRAFLMRDEDYAAYALGDLDPPYSEHAIWYGACQGDQIEALVLHYPVLEPPVLFLMGEVSGLDLLLRDTIQTESVYYTAKSDLESLLSDHLRLHGVHQMFRMRVTQSTFVPCESSVHTVKLEAEHADQIRALLHRAATVDSRAIHDIAFAPQMLADGYYRGVFDNEQLIAAAGTHIIAKRSRIAAVGNVVVDPEARRRGLGTVVTAAVTQALLLDNFHLIVLNVSQDNAAAVATYRKLGYQHTGNFIEGLAER